MAGRRKQKIISTFYCINCGKQGIPIWRYKGRQRKEGHRKALWCTTCKLTVNHVEIVTPAEAERFREDFAAGKYREEAEESIAYAREHLEGR